MAVPIISLKNIQKGYDSGAETVHAIHPLTLDIYQGEFVAIVGASGSGKSTLLSILGFLDTPSAGDYFFCGQNVTHFSSVQLAYLRNQVAGFIFQQFYLLPGLTALENVALPLMYSSSYSEVAAKEKLKQVGLGHRLYHFPNTLSGGERQRVSTARALINRPQILFADEPTGSLDTRNEAEIMDILKGLHADGMTIVMVTHEQEIASQAQRVVTMRDGAIISDVYQQSPVPHSGLEPQTLHARQPFTGISFWMYAKQAVSAMMAKKLRTFLSLLGIFIGVLSVMTMIAIGDGAQDAIQRHLAYLGSNRLLVRPGPAKAGTVMMPAVRRKFALEDSVRIAALANIKSVGAIRQGRCQIVGNGQNWNTTVMGVELVFPDMRDSWPVYGRFFNENELHSRSRVALLGDTVTRRIFGQSDPLGKDIYVDKIPFTVIGILPAKGEQGGNDRDDVVVIPITTSMYRLFGDPTVDSFEVDVASAEYIESAKSEIKALFHATYNRPISDTDFLGIKDMAAIRQSIEGTVHAIQLLLSIVAAISLVIGGIGIMNIMLVSVTERTREIGVRKALGATETDILIQFMIESIVITGMGGFLGVVFGAGLSKLIGFFTGWTIVISVFSVCISAGFSITIGLVFGILPARQASKLKTVEALRYE